LSGGDGGRSSPRCRPGLGGDGGPWRVALRGGEGRPFLGVHHPLGSGGGGPVVYVVVVIAVASKIQK
jgi:hypothetical protein